MIRFQMSRVDFLLKLILKWHTLGLIPSLLFRKRFIEVSPTNLLIFWPSKSMLLWLTSLLLLLQFCLQVIGAAASAFWFTLVRYFYGIHLLSETLEVSLGESGLEHAPFVVLNLSAKRLEVFFLFVYLIVCD